MFLLRIYNFFSNLSLSDISVIIKKGELANSALVTWRVFLFSSYCGKFRMICCYQVREMKVKVLVQQIMKGSENIKENMDHVWRNLEYIEETYEQMFLKTHRIQVWRNKTLKHNFLYNINLIMLLDKVNVSLYKSLCRCSLVIFQSKKATSIIFVLI